MDSDAVIGKLYRTLLESDEQKQLLLNIIAGIKSGEISLDRISFNNGALQLAAQEHNEVITHSKPDC